MFDKKQSLKVKGIAICMLLFHHLFYSSQRIDANGVNFYLFSQETVMSFATGLRVCVWIFAFISAYGLTVQYMALGDAPSGKDCVAFVKKRWLSLMKPYWFIFGAVLIVFAVLGKNPMDLFKGSLLNLALSALGLSDFFGTPMPVAAWWYMCFAQILVVAVPFLAELCKKFGVLTLAAAFLMIPYLGAGINSSFGGSYVNYLFVVIMGVLCAQNGVMEKLGKRSGRWYVCVTEFFGLIAAITVCVAINMKYAGIDTWKFTKLFMAAAAVLISLLVYKYFTNRTLEAVLVFLGRHSGNIFLIHAFGYTFVPKAVYWSGNVPLTFLTLLAESLLASMACEAVMTLVTRRRRVGKD